jgi:hypothetical protein
MKTVCLFIALLFAVGCTSGRPEKFTINGHTRVQTQKKFCGVPIYTKIEEVKTTNQQLDDLDVEAKENKLKSLERQKAAAFWIGLVLMVLAPVCIVIGYISSGWKFWGTMAVISGSLGAGFWGFEYLIPYLKWGVGGLLACVVLWTMWKVKDFSLIDRLKNSEPGRLM